MTTELNLGGMFLHNGQGFPLQCSTSVENIFGRAPHFWSPTSIQVHKLCILTHCECECFPKYIFLFKFVLPNDMVGNAKGTTIFLNACDSHMCPLIVQEIERGLTELG